MKTRQDRWLDNSEEENLLLLKFPFLLWVFCFWGNLLCHEKATQKKKKRNELKYERNIIRKDPFWWKFKNPYKNPLRCNLSYNYRVKIDFGDRTIQAGYSLWTKHSFCILIFLSNWWLEKQISGCYMSLLSSSKNGTELSERGGIACLPEKWKKLILNDGYIFHYFLLYIWNDRYFSLHVTTCIMFHTTFKTEEGH